ncbi:MAG: glycosyltransferase family 39 protein [Anaerolineaceae bacterium]|nr:glycosyltransferase family 39 protein [Anaerolineaceae bacterium]
MQKLTTPERRNKGRRTTPDWLWALAPMLLAAALVMPFLGRGIFDVDEAATMIGACARHLGPCSPLEAVRESLRWPDQAWGQAIVFSQWGQLVGWSEFAMRVLPWLTGPLALAWVYRLGRDLFSATIARTAAFLLATSVLFLTYLHIARSFIPAMLFASITMWGYWQVVLADKSPKREARVALLLGATALLYTQYFCALLVPALGLFHLLFLRRNRGWWHALSLLALAGVLALPQVPDLLKGIAFNQGNEGLHDWALRAPEVLSLFLRYLSNGILSPGELAGRLLLPALSLLLLFVVRNTRGRRQPDAVGFLTGTSTLLLLLIVSVNEWILVLEPRRVRYLASLWPPTLLLISAIIHRLLRDALRYLMFVPVALIALSGTLDFLQRGELIRHSWDNREHPVTLPVAHRIVAEACSDSLLLVDPFAFRYENRSYELYTGAWGLRRIPLHPDAAITETIERTLEREGVWLLYRTAFEEALHVPEIVEGLRQEGWSLSLDWKDGEVTLRQLRSPLRLRENDRVAPEFNGQIRWAGSWIALQDGRLLIRVDLRSADHNLPGDYSLALHVIDPRTGQLVAQGDVGIGPGTCIPVRSNIDISALPAGDYELQVALYDWQTGERLGARDLQTGAISDIHVLQRFRIG